MDKKEEVIVDPADAMLSADLRVTLAKLLPIIKEDDCAAFIILVKPGGAEVRIVTDATWSCAQIDQAGTFKLTTSSLPVETRDETIAQTGNMLSALADITAQAAVEFMTASEYVNQRFGLTHSMVEHVGDPKVH